VSLRQSAPSRPCSSAVGARYREPSRPSLRDLKTSSKVTPSTTSAPPARRPPPEGYRAARLPFVHVSDTLDFSAQPKSYRATARGARGARSGCRLARAASIDIMAILSHMPQGIPVALEVPMTSMSPLRVRQGGSACTCLRPDQHRMAAIYSSRCGCGLVDRFRRSSSSHDYDQRRFPCAKIFCSAKLVTKIRCRTADWALDEEEP
jgi:hypothetical protein